MIKGRVYYYLIFRYKGRFRAIYRGKACAAEIEKFRKVKEYRAKYRRLLSQAKKQIHFLRSALRGKESI